MGRPLGTSKYKFAPNQQIGSWTVIDGTTSGAPAKLTVQCTCGTRKQVDVYSLVNGRSTNCGCARAMKKGLQKTDISRAMAKASRSGNLLTPEYLTDLFEAQRGSCVVTNKPLTETGMTLSTIDKSKGYQSGNVAWVSSEVSPFTNSCGIMSSVTIANSITNSQPDIFKRLGFTQGD